MATQIKLRRGTAAQWTESNPTLAAGEAGFETDTNQLKIGNGTDNWSTLDYISSDLTPYLLSSTASTIYAPLNDPIFTDDITVSGTIVLNEGPYQINFGSSSPAYISSFEGMGTELNVVSDDNVTISATNGINSVYGNLLLLNSNTNVVISGTTGEYINSSASANQIATIGDVATKDDKILTIPAERTSTFVVQLTDANRFIEVNGTFNINIPTNASVAFPIGTQMTFLNTGSGTITFAASTPGTTTLNATPGPKLRTQWSSATLIKRKTESWVLIGDLIA